MNRRYRQLLAAVMVVLVASVFFAAAAYASDDNSLADLGIKTEGAVVSPEFRYDTWEYTVEVPAGTKTLELEPHTTNPTATVNSVTGTTLDPDGTGTVIITVTSESGNVIEYVLKVSQAREPMDPAAAIAANESSVSTTIDTEVVQSEVETEDPRYVKVDRNSLEDAEKTITEQRSHITMLTYVLYALIAVSIIFLFIVISQLLRRRDIAQELAFYKNGNAHGGSVAEDGWGEWGDEEGDRAASAWTREQIGTPVQPQNHPYRGGQYPPRPQQDRQMGPGQANSRQGNPRQMRQTAGADQMNERQARQASGANQANSRQAGQAYGADQAKSRQAGQTYGADQANSRQMRQAPGGRDFAQRRGKGASGETRRYEAVQPVHPQEVPKDVTKDLTRVNKAEAKAMKKAAAAEARREQEARKAAQARSEEAKRQAQEAQRIAKEQEAARRAQEEALEKAASQRAKQEAESQARGEKPNADKGKNVKIDMIDL